MLFDSHAHYDDKKFDTDRNSLLASMPENNVGLIMNACSSADDIKTITEICESFSYVYGAVGVHPSDCKSFSDKDIQCIRNAAKHSKIKAIGEIGLDYYYDDVPREKQKECFISQIEIAKELKMPIIVHDRDAHADTVDILKQCGAEAVGGVIHCFSGSCDMAKSVLDMGFYIAFGGTLTFKNARKSVEAAQYAPIDRILLETDSPYLAPEPLRGKRNDSTLMHYVAERLAEIKGIDVSQIERITFDNAKKCFNIS